MLSTAEKMYLETGFEIDFDFFIDYEKEQVQIFDFDFQDYGSDSHLRMMANLVSRKYGVAIPEGLIQHDRSKHSL